MKKRKRGRPKGTKNEDKARAELEFIEPEKAKLIKFILKTQPKYYKLAEIDYTKYTIEQLQKHVDLVKKKREIK